MVLSVSAVQPIWLFKIINCFQVPVYENWKMFENPVINLLLLLKIQQGLEPKCFFDSGSIIKKNIWKFQLFLINLMKCLIRLELVFK